jgi:hypothetical protein
LHRFDHRNPRRFDLSRAICVLFTFLAIGVTSVASHTTPAIAQPSPNPEAAESLLAVSAGHGFGVAPDRLQHFSLAFASGLAIGLVTEEPAAAGGGSLALGIGKELLDVRRGGRFDGIDLLADVLGAGLALLVTAALR